MEIQRQRITEIFNENYSLAVFHHWDTDGIASAALLLRKHEKQVTALMTPKIGFYSEEAINATSVLVDADYIVFLDYGVNGKTYDKIRKKLNKPLIVIDHHLTEPWNNNVDSVYYNPVALGLGGEAEYPSTTSLLPEILSIRGEHEVTLVALGMIGDLAPYLDSGVNHQGLKLLRKLVANINNDVPTLRRVVDMLDSCYRIYDEMCIRHVVRKLAFENVKAIINDQYLLETYAQSKEIISKAFNSLHKIFSNTEISVFYLRMDAYVTSHLGRRLAKDNPDKIIILVHEIPKIGGGFIYVRSMRITLKSLIKSLRDKGFRVGGKETVAVIEFTGNHENCLRKVLATLRDTY